MQQVVQNLRSGVTELLDVAAPRVSRGHVLVQTRASLISAGTERMLVEFGKASLIAKARQQPEKVRQILDKIRTDGLLPTLEAVFAKLDEPLPLGYCSAGVVIEVGADVIGYKVGDRVASNAPHAAIVNQPVNLVARIPDNVSFEDAAFTPLAAIALQGIRLMRPEIGETIVVFGLGLVGLLAVQLLVAGGTRVLAIDLDPARLELARQFGATTIDPSTTDDPIAGVLAQTSSHGADGVLITASAKEDTILSQSAKMSRQRGRIVLVGVCNTNLSRADFYQKELSFQVSCSYGPGRYDPNYEEQGIDYPYSFVRWTEQRNFEAVLELIASNRLRIAPLITHRCPHADAAKAYDLLSNDRKQLGIVFDYPEAAALDRVVPVKKSVASGTPAKTTGAGVVTVGVIGAGNFTIRGLLPALAKTGAKLRSIASAGGMTAAHAARKFGFDSSTTDYRTLLADPRINLICVTTRPNLHPRMVAEALAAGKHVFVEKPLAIDAVGLDEVKQAHAATTGRQLLVGFNRRFAPHVIKMRELLTGRTQPLCADVLINAGTLPADHWTQDPKIGGGRMIGEGCHWIDLLRYLVGAPITAVQSATIGRARGVTTTSDHMTVALSFADGSIGMLHYFANGHRAFPKERVTVFSDGRVLELDNFRILRGHGFRGFSKMRLFRQDKGHQAELQRLVDAIARGGECVLPADEIWNVTEATLAAELAANGGRVALSN